MLSMEHPSEFELAIVPEFDMQTVPQPEDDGDIPDAGVPGDAPASWQPTFGDEDFSLIAEDGRDHDESDDDFEFDDFDDEPDDDDLADDFDDDDDDDDLDDDLDDDDL